MWAQDTFPPFLADPLAAEKWQHGFHERLMQAAGKRHMSPVGNDPECTVFGSCLQDFYGKGSVPLSLLSTLCSRSRLMPLRDGQEGEAQLVAHRVGSPSL